MNTIDDYPSIFRGSHRELNVNAPNDEYSILALNLAAGFGNQAALACIDFARFQRAPEGA